MRRLIVVVGALALVAVAARADVLILRDGRIIDGRPIERTPEGAKVGFEAGQVLVPWSLVEDVLVEGAETTFEPQTEEEKEKFEKGLVRYEGRWMPISRRNALVQEKVEEKHAELAEIRERSLWRNRWQEQTKHFEFESTLPPKVFSYYRDLMEAYFEAFSKTWKVRQPKEYGRLKVCFYANMDDYLRIGGAPGGSLGYFKFSLPFELNCFYDRNDRTLTEGVLFHETNHYLQQLIDTSFSMPHFPGEALAEFYGASVYDPVKKELTVGLIQEGRLAGMRNEIDAGEMLELKKMLETSQMYEHYSWGWSLVHFLMNDKSLSKKFEKWVLALAKARDVARVPVGLRDLKTVEGAEVLGSFMRYMGLKDEEDLKELEKEWHEYVKGLKFESARGKEKAAQAAERAGRRIRATRLYQEAIDAGGASPAAYDSLARLIDDKEPDKAVELWRKAIELDPLVGQYYVGLAGALDRKGEKEEAVRLAKLALEVDPGDMWMEHRARQLIGE